MAHIRRYSQRISPCRARFSLFGHHREGEGGGWTHESIRAMAPTVGVLREHQILRFLIEISMNHLELAVFVHRSADHRS